MRASLPLLLSFAAAPANPAAVDLDLQIELQRRIIQEWADQHTDRLEVSLTGFGRYRARAGKGVKGFSLLLPRRIFEEGRPIEVGRNGKKVRRRTRASREVLLAEFAERFDRVW